MRHSSIAKNPTVKSSKRITISDIAQLAGVSKATTSLVLNGRSKEYRVADETRDRILALAASIPYWQYLGYVR